MVPSDLTRPQDVLAANLRRMRIARRLSLSELARATGMSKATLSSVESGRSNPTVETLASLAGGPAGVTRRTAGGAAAGRGANRAPPRPHRGGRHRVCNARTWEPRQVEEPEPGPAGSRAGVYVLEGKLIAGPVERVTELSTGDYASFPVDVPYLFEAGRTAARALVLDLRALMIYGPRTAALGSSRRGVRVSTPEHAVALPALLHRQTRAGAARAGPPRRRRPLAPRGDDRLLAAAAGADRDCPLRAPR